MQRAALLDAARSLLSEGGTEALTFPALAERTGLARSSVYEYFRSRASVVEELCQVDFPVWAAEVEAAMAAVERPEDKVEAYVRKQLQLVGDRRHRAVVAISASELDAGAREKIRAAHGGLVAMIVEAIVHDTHEVMPLSILMQGQYGIRDVCLSLPCVVGRAGVLRVLEPDLSESEVAALRQSADVVRSAIGSVPA